MDKLKIGWGKKKWREKKFACSDGDFFAWEEESVEYKNFMYEIHNWRTKQSRAKRDFIGTKIKRFYEIRGASR